MTRRRPRHASPFDIDGLVLKRHPETGHVTDIRRPDPATGADDVRALADPETGRISAIAPDWQRAIDDPTRRVHPQTHED